MKNSILKYLVVLLTILTYSNINSQTCGFGCLGLSGIYAGYSIQQYEANGLNNYLNEIVHPSHLSNIQDDKFDFNEASGFKIGINLVRADYPNFFFTFKGFYQFLSEEQTIEIPDGMGYDFTYNAKLEMNNWGFGLDFGIPFGTFVDWKIIDGELKFFSPKLTFKSGYNNPAANYFGIDNKYTPVKVKMGFSLGSGFLFHIIEDYISVEATGSYTFVEIDYLLSDKDGSRIPFENSSDKFISKGGLQGLIQINIGMPL